jgi:pimeloyl-ACP methyl ester carboxylesterase
MIAVGHPGSMPIVSASAWCSQWAQREQRNPPAGICGALLALASRTDTTASLPQISVPTLILVGEQDALTPPSVAKAVREKIRNSELHVIPCAAHMSNLENRAEFNQHLLEFLEELG